MTTKRKVVSQKNLPMPWPVALTWLAALSQSVWNMPGWSIGVMWTMVVIVWLIVAITIFTSEQKELFNDD